MIACHTRNRVSSQKVTMYVAIALTAFYFSFVAGRGISDVMNPSIKSPVPNGYEFEVQTVEAEEAVHLTPEVTQAPTSTPTPTSIPAPVVDSNEVVEYIKSKPWPVHEALAVAKCESGYYALAHGDKHLDPSSYGVFQIRSYSTRPPIHELLDYKANIDYAYYMWTTQGWEPWTCKYVLN